MVVGLKICIFVYCTLFFYLSWWSLGQHNVTMPQNENYLTKKEFRRHSNTSCGETPVSEPLSILILEAITLVCTNNQGTSEQHV